MNNLTLRPMHDRVVVKVKALPERTGMIIRVDAGREESVREAEVVAVGNGVRDVEVGDTILVNVLTGQLIGETLVIPESAVLGKIHDEEVRE